MIYSTEELDTNPICEAIAVVHALIWEIQSRVEAIRNAIKAFFIA